MKNSSDSSMADNDRPVHVQHLRHIVVQIPLWPIMTAKKSSIFPGFFELSKHAFASNLRFCLDKIICRIGCVCYNIAVQFSSIFQTINNNKIAFLV